MSDKQRLVELLRKKKENDRVNQLRFYSPLPFQEEMHNDPEQFVGLIAGNRPGKATLAERTPQSI